MGNNVYNKDYNMIQTIVSKWWVYYDKYIDKNIERMHLPMMFDGIKLMNE